MFTLRQKCLLTTLTKCCKRKDSHRILHKIDCDLIKLLSEVSLNILYGNLTIPKNILLKLKRHKQKLLFLSNKRNSLSRKRTLINQSGGFLSLLLPLLSQLLQ